MSLPLPSFPLLCKAFTAADAALLAEGIPTLQRKSYLISLSWKSIRCDECSVRILTAMAELNQQAAFKTLHPHCWNVLAWCGAATLAAWSRDPAWARLCAQQTWAAGLSTWHPAAWQPWMGPRPIRYKDGIQAKPETAPEDPSGDPEELPELEQLERSGTEIWQWCDAGQILEGLNHWEWWLQNRFGLPLGVMARGEGLKLPGLEHPAVNTAFTIAA